MRYSSAVVLSTLAVGQAAAAHLHNRHASFHARRHADAKRSDAVEGVNWDALAYDLKDVDWNKVNYGSPSPAPTPAPTPEAAPKVEEQPEEKPETTKEAKVQAVASTKEAPKPEPTKDATVSKESIGDDIGDAIGEIGDAIGGVVDDLLHGVESLCKKLGISKVGKNDKSDNGAMWIGKDSPWNAQFTNDANEDSVLFCWRANGFSGMSLNVAQPDISVGLKSGEKVDISFAPNVPLACAPAFSDSKLAMFGGIEDTWFEATLGRQGAFDISRNVNMNGRQITAKGSKCVSDMNTCVFKCKDSSRSSCEAGSDYDLFNCGANNGGGGGYDPIMAGTGGGCAMGNNGETIKVSFS